MRMRAKMTYMNIMGVLLVVESFLPRGDSVATTRYVVGIKGICKFVFVKTVGRDGLGKSIV